MSVIARVTFSVSFLAHMLLLQWAATDAVPALLGLQVLRRDNNGGKIKGVVFSWVLGCRTLELFPRCSTGPVRPGSQLALRARPDESLARPRMLTCTRQLKEKIADQATELGNMATAAAALEAQVSEKEEERRDAHTSVMRLEAQVTKYCMTEGV